MKLQGLLINNLTCSLYSTNYTTTINAADSRYSLITEQVAITIIGHSDFMLLCNGSYACDFI